MHVGFSVTFQNPFDQRADADVYHRELGFALQAEMWGFDSIWTVEHHFTDYTMCPDPLQLLTWLAGQTRSLRLGTAVVVLPWHDPIRVAEQIALLDNLSGGRLILGLGRGLARVEYDGFRVDFDVYRRVWADENAGTAPPAPMCGGFVVVDKDAGRAEELAHRYIGGYYATVLRHYEFESAPHAGVEGYEFYTHITRYLERH